MDDSLFCGAFHPRPQKSEPVITWLMRSHSESLSYLMMVEELGLLVKSTQILVDIGVGNVTCINGK